MSDVLEFAVTRHQPEAWAISTGYCPVIHFATRPRLEYVGNLIAIHAADSLSRRSLEAHRFADPILASLGLRMPQPYTAGALIGVARLVGVMRRSSQQERVHLGYGEYRHLLDGGVTAEVPAEDVARIRPWVRPDWKWLLLLRDAAFLPEPIPMRGAGGLWRLTGRISARMQYPGNVVAWALEQWQRARG